MKKRFIAVMTLIVSAAFFFGCGSSTGDTKVIEGQQGAVTSADGEAAEAVKGYAFTAEGLTMAVDTDASAYIDALPEADSYYESPSCAAEGIGKLYSYKDFDIQTYPEGDRDLVLYIRLKTDNVATEEGIDLSKTKDDIKAAYGDPSEESDSSLTYEKDGMSLIFLFDGENMISIEYDSPKA
ncbi:MAG: hypothetical protein K6A69_08455 [Lachnospiraceae bacterium]|nr:hypothetical protein [Lachnospiraceae bacterium]